MTCSIREGAENKVWDELKVLRKIRRKNGVIGVLGTFILRVVNISLYVMQLLYS